MPRVSLSSPKPDALLGEALRQIRIQFPEYADRSSSLESLASYRFDVEEDQEFAKSAHFNLSNDLTNALSALLNDIAASSNQNILFIIDTFEIVQRRGSTAVYTVLRTAADLLARSPRLRVVIIGRSNFRPEDFSNPDDWPEYEALPLKGFDTRSGRSYLAQRLKNLKATIPDIGTLDRVVSLVRGNALGLRLAATVMAREGVTGVEDAIGRQRLDERIAQEQIQGFLHARIVEHLDNPQLRRIADPGLIVRRITPEVIEKVLAPACGIQFDAAHTPDTLFDQLTNEVALVEIVGPRAVRHRSDVRTLMLPWLRRKLGQTAEQIDRAAVAYWSTKSDPDERAEEIYHRLWLGEYEGLDQRWDEGARKYLEDALDELAELRPKSVGRVWLAGKLGRELPEDVRNSVDQLAWEWDTNQKARTLMSASRFDEVLFIIRQRPAAARTPASPLWLIEVDALQLRGHAQEALDVADQAIARMAGVDDPAHVHALLIRKGAIEERLVRYDAAIATAHESLGLAEDMRDPERIFASGIALSRLLGKIGTPGAGERATVRQKLEALANDPAVRQALMVRPALLREAAAEIGATQPELLAQALERLGLGTDERAGGTADLPDSITSLYSATDSMLDPGAAQQLGARAAEAVRSSRATTAAKQALADLFSRAVDRLMHQQF